MGRTSIQLSDETADDLYELKRRGDSYEDVVKRLLEGDQREFTVVDEQTAVNYGPSSKLEDGWVLAVTTEDGVVDLHIPEVAMYDLWIEVQGRPWPDRTEAQEEEAKLRRRLVDRANGADAETLRDALKALPET